MRAVEAPAIKAGDDARVDLRLTQRALEKSNDRLEQSRGWYDNIRKLYQRK
jgi:hypothetical protein